MGKGKWCRYGNPADLDGFNLPGLELFKRGGQVPSVVRETGQNTIDNPDKSKKPVVIKYKRYDIPTKQFPGREDLIEIIKACLEFGIQSDQKETDDPMIFMKNALDLLQDEEGVIPMLEISDENTTGIIGEDRNYKKPWSRMTDAIGISDGGESSRGGSRGIGKFAPLLLSSLRAVFISTKTSNESVAFKGTAQFTSFQQEGVDYSAKIKFQLSDRISIRTEAAIPAYFRRYEIGTSIHIAGFKLKGNWMDEIIKASLQNFYAAIYGDKLILEGDGHKVDSSTIESYINSHADERTKMFYKCLCNGKKITTEFEGFGKVELYVLIDETCEKRIDYMRDKRMKIYDEKKGTLLTKNFAAVFICVGEEGSKKLRLMEGAEHVSWKPRDRTEGKELKRLKNWIDEQIQSFEPVEEEEESTISGTENLLPMVDDGEGQGFGGIGANAQDEETARELVNEHDKEIIVDEKQEGGIIIINPEGTISVVKKKVRINKRKPNPKPNPDTLPYPDPKTKVKPKPKISRINVDRFKKTIVKNDREDSEYHLFIESDLDNEILVDLGVYAVAEHGERILGFTCLKSAYYHDKNKIVKKGGEDQLIKVRLNPGINKLILRTKDNNKYAFNIDGYESN